MTGRRLGWMAGALAAVLVLAALAAVLVVRGAWFRGKLRAELVSRLEAATGGHVEIGSFHFDWQAMRVVVTDLTLHGTEPAGKPPLIHCAQVALGLRIVSLVERDVDIDSLEVTAPRIYLIVAADGRTNIPRPKVTSSRNAVETVLKLAIARFAIRHGEVDVESRGATVFDASGHNFDARLTYDAAAPSYGGEISIRPLELRWPGVSPMPVMVAARATLERNHVEIGNMTLEAGNSRVALSGAIEDLASPHGAFHYDARVTNADAMRMLGVKLLDRGTVESAGEATWMGGSNFRTAGSLRAYGLEYHDRVVRLHGFTASGKVELTPSGIDVRALRLAGRAGSGSRELPVQGTVAVASLRGRDVALGGVSMGALGGTFRGRATLRNLSRYTVEGDIAGFDARRTVALYSVEALPWDALAAGGVRLEGEFGHADALRAKATLDISPAPASAPVRGRVEAAYDAASGLLDLGRSTVALPHSSATVSGAIGRELRVHAETRDLHDLLPVLGESAAALPLTLAGDVDFQGTVTGRLDDPRISGRLRAGAFAYEGREFQGLDADVTASPENIHLANARLSRAGWRAGFDMAVALRGWKAEDASAVFGGASFTDLPVSDLTSLAGRSLPVTGALSGKAGLTGTVGNPLIQADLALRHGSYLDETIDAFTAHADYSARRLRMAGGKLTAGGKQIQLDATYDHQPGNYARGRLAFQLSTNAMPLRQIHWMALRHPEVQGTLQVTAQGTLEAPFRLDQLNADIAARGLKVYGPGGQSPPGDLRLTAKSQGGVLQAHLESGLAGSPITGDGQWRLAGDYPGSATLSMARVDFAQLRSWLVPAGSTVGEDVSGFTSGSLHVEGPALKPEALQADLRLPELEIGVAAADLRLRNAGPVAVHFANGSANIQSARLTGRNTDLSAAGKITLQGKPTVDARVTGRVDLAIVHDWNHDFTAAGILQADATVRGPLGGPQIGGRLEFQHASFSIAGVPNGISNATGAIAFTGDRASIQNFSGDTGGGRVQLSGFAVLGGGPIVFRVHVALSQVRVRYPEGVSTVADANLNFTGSTDRSMLAGSITVLRTSFNSQSDFSSLMAQSAEPVRAPAVRTGFLGGLNFDVNLQTSPDVQVESTLTQNVQLDANLHLRGTVGAPALLGRVNINGGQLAFFGTRYRIEQGSISFFNPLAVEPVLDVDLETKSRGVDVTLTVSGPLNKLGLTYRSDPPLQFSEIVALLATGRAPTSNAALMSSENPAAQPFQQMGASALLGQAISSPVTGRLQRFFGVSQLRIDPTLPGVEYNPQARLTLQQQVTQNITFTYITDVTSTNPQVVSVEWAFAKQWSAVAQREENGMIGMDIIFKKRF